MGSGQITISLIFQPTRPLRGATPDGAQLQRQKQYFNPRAPCGARPQIPLYLIRATRISTHAPLAGRDRQVRHPCIDCPCISTHAPLAGRDSLRSTLAKSDVNFNPRAPCGARLLLLGFPESRFDFNPRAPCGARLQKCTNHYAHFCDNRQISDAFAQNADCQGILFLFDAGKPCGFWVRTAQVISARLCFAL